MLSISIGHKHVLIESVLVDISIVKLIPFEIVSEKGIDVKFELPSRKQEKFNSHNASNTTLDP